MQTLVILVIDDDSYQVLLPWLVRKAGVALALYFVEDGDVAIDYLERQGKFADTARFPFPNLLLLDIKMARIGGFEFLAWKRKHADLDFLPTIVWSSSNLESDRQTAFSLGATDYFHKPVGNNGLMEVLLLAEKHAHIFENKKTLEPAESKSQINL